MINRILNSDITKAIICFLIGIFSFGIAIENLLNYANHF